MTHDELQNNSSDTGTKVPMTHDELLAKIDYLHYRQVTPAVKALRAVVELSKPYLAGEVYVNPEFNQGVMAAFRLMLDTIERELG